jgi:hypothetical protein
MKPHEQARAWHAGVPAFAESPHAGSRFCTQAWVPKNHTYLRQCFGGSSANQRNPPKHDRIIAYDNSARSYTFLHGQGRIPLRRQMTKLLIFVQF